MQTLINELRYDPLGRGYAAMTDQEVVDSLNAADREQAVTVVTGQQIFEAVVQAEWAALSDAQKSLFAMVVGMGEVLVAATNTRRALLAMFGPGTQTRTNLAALQTRLISRASELGINPHAGDVAAARSMI